VGGIPCRRRANLLATATVGLTGAETTAGASIAGIDAKVSGTKTR
jgi:hypothetical protein